MVIRPAQSGDLAAIEEIVERAYGGYVERIGMRPGPMDDDYALRLERGLVWVAVEEPPPGPPRAPAPLGLLVLVEQPDQLLIENVAVDPDRQGEGIGAALLDFAEARARELGYRAAALYTHEKMSENIALYESRGYAETKRSRENGFSRVFLRKNL